MIATNNLGIYTAGQIGTFSDMDAPKRKGRRRPPLETFSVARLEELLGLIDAARGSMLAAKNSLAKHGEQAKVKVNYGPAVRAGLKAVGWLADDVIKKIDKDKVFTDEGSLPTEDTDLPAKPSKSGRSSRGRK